MSKKIGYGAMTMIFGAGHLGFLLLEVDHLIKARWMVIKSKSKNISRWAG
ncbi:hypothetical protein ES704_03920 [subsurface metagenome]